MTLYLHKVTVRFHKVIVRFHKVTVSTNYEIELKNQYLMLDNFIICYSIKIFITLQYYINDLIYIVSKEPIIGFYIGLRLRV